MALVVGAILGIVGLSAAEGLAYTGPVATTNSEASNKPSYWGAHCTKLDRGNGGTSWTADKSYDLVVLKAGTTDYAFRDVLAGDVLTIPQNISHFIFCPSTTTTATTTTTMPDESTTTTTMPDESTTTTTMPDESTTTTTMPDESTTTSTTTTTTVPEDTTTTTTTTTPTVDQQGCHEHRRRVGIARGGVDDTRDNAWVIGGQPAVHRITPAPSARCGPTTTTIVEETTTTTTVVAQQAPTTTTIVEETTTTVVAQQGPTTTVTASGATTTVSARLPSTGSELRLAVLGGLLIAVGATLLTLSRMRTV